MSNNRSQVRCLNFANRSLSDDELREAIHKLSSVQNDGEGFHEIDFSGNLLTAVGLSRLLLSAYDNHFCSLRIVKLYKNCLGDAAAGYLAGICKDCPMLAELHLSHNNLTGSGVKEVVNACAFKTCATSVTEESQTTVPLWLRLEMNHVRKPRLLLETFAVRRLNVCSMTKRCTPSCCVLGMAVHLPHFLNQRECNITREATHSAARIDGPTLSKPRAADLRWRSAPRSVVKLQREAASLPEDVVRSIVLGESGENLKYFRDAHPGVTVKFKFNADAEGPALVIHATASAHVPQDALAAAIAASKEAEEDVRDLVRTVRAELKAAAKDGRPSKEDGPESRTTQEGNGTGADSEAPRPKSATPFWLDQVDAELKMRILEIAESYELGSVIASEARGNANPQQVPVLDTPVVSQSETAETPRDMPTETKVGPSCMPQNTIECDSADNLHDDLAHHADDSSEGETASVTSIPATWEDAAEADSEGIFEKRLAWLRMDPDMQNSVVALVREPGEFNDEDEDCAEQESTSLVMGASDSSKTSVSLCSTMDTSGEKHVLASSLDTCRDDPVDQVLVSLGQETSTPASWEDLFDADRVEAAQAHENDGCDDAAMSSASQQLHTQDCLLNQVKVSSEENADRETLECGSWQVPHEADRNDNFHDQSSTHTHPLTNRNPLQTNLFKKIALQEDVHIADGSIVQTAMVTGEPRVVHQGKGFLVLFKPPHCLCDTEVNSKGVARYVWGYGIEDVDKAVCHRLDYATSGLLLVGTETHVASELVRQRNARMWNKHYVCLMHGWLPADRLEGSLNFKLKTTRQGNGFKTFVDEKKGTWARTLYVALAHYRCRTTNRRFTLLGCSIVTGRTHQIRVHLRELAIACGLEWCGIVGDAKYLPSAGLASDLALFQRASINAKMKVEPRLCLHACALGFASPHSRRRLAIRCGIPNDILCLIEHAMEPVPYETYASSHLSYDLQWILQDIQKLICHEAAVEGANRTNGMSGIDFHGKQLGMQLTSLQQTFSLGNVLRKCISQSFRAWASISKQKHGGHLSLGSSNQACLHAAFEWWHGLVFIAPALLCEYLSSHRKGTIQASAAHNPSYHSCFFSQEAANRMGLTSATRIELPPEWKAQWDPISAEYYYWNTKTRDVSWDHPAQLDGVKCLEPIDIGKSTLSTRPAYSRGVLEYVAIESWAPCEMDETIRTCIRITCGERVSLESETLDGWALVSVVPEAGESMRSGWIPRKALSANPAPHPKIFAERAHVKVTTDYSAPSNGYLSAFSGELFQVRYQVEPYVWVWCESLTDARRNGWVPEAILEPN